MAAIVPMARPIWTEEMRKEAIETLDSGIWVKGPKNRLFSDNSQNIVRQVQPYHAQVAQQPYMLHLGYLESGLVMR